MELKDALLQLVLGLILVLGVILGGFTLLGYLLKDTGPEGHFIQLDSFLEEEVN